MHKYKRFPVRVSCHGQEWWAVNQDELETICALVAKWTKEAREVLARYSTTRAEAIRD